MNGHGRQPIVAHLVNAIGGLCILLFFIGCAISPQPTTTSIPSTATLVPATLPDFFRGVDLSYVNEMEDCGAVYRVNGETQEPFALFAERGANLVRARLWHNPTWTEYSTLADVTKTFQRAKEASLFTMLTIHYSDEWADPGSQNIPAAWQGIEETDELATAVYDYTRDVLLTLHENGAMPDFVQIGNETNPGLLKERLDNDWPRDAQLFNAGIRAVRDVTEELGVGPQIVLHVAQPENTGWWFRDAVANGITDFDVIGISYYPQWSTFSIAEMGSQVTYLRQTFGKEVMVVETAYPWTYETAGDTADNVLDKGISAYPVSVTGQRQFLIDLTQSLINNGAQGVVYWEPAWVSTDCTTRWGQGSHWENATFFDFTQDNELHVGIGFLGAEYTRPSLPIDGVIESAYGEPLLTDGTGDNLGQSYLDLTSLHVTDDEDSFYLALTVADNALAAQEGTYLIYLDITHDEQGAPVDVGRRPITVAAPYKPEFRLDVQIREERGTVGGRYQLFAWDGAEWQEVTLTGAATIQGGSPTIIEVQIPKTTLQNPQTLFVGAVSAGRGRVHTAVDILGSDFAPQELEEAVVLDVFGEYMVRP
ncbi:MAG: arabinogalactan endo-1,4-beta-galactosidase [Anaerolineae bacterium]|nr:arabinogalactan endo-1,4-beta-galactosidase [Anaerolineae bacterium]